MTKQTPTHANVVCLKQMLNFIPRGMIKRIARETGVEDKSRTFTPASHLAAMLFAQLFRAIGLNDVCDWLRLKAPVQIHRLGAHRPARAAEILRDSIGSLSGAGSTRSSVVAGLYSHTHVTSHDIMGQHRPTNAVKHQSPFTPNRSPSLGKLRSSCLPVETVGWLWSYCIVFCVCFFAVLSRERRKF